MISSGGQCHQENGAVVGRAALWLGDCFRAGSQKAGVPESEHCNFLSLATLLGFSKLPIARASQVEGLPQMSVPGFEMKITYNTHHNELLQVQGGAV